MVRVQPNQSLSEVRNNSPDAPPTEDTRDQEKEDTPPPDRFHLVFIIMLIHGVGTLMPWNMFMNANAYFVEYKLCGDHVDDKYRKYFLSSLGLVAIIPNLLLNVFNLCLQCISGNIETRMAVTLVIMVFSFIITVFLAILDSSTWAAAFFWMTMVTVVIVQMATGVYHNSVFGMAACFPMKYTSAVILGLNCSGIFTSVLNIVCIWISPNPRTAGIYYFMGAIVVLLVVFDTFYMLPLSTYYRYHTEKTGPNSHDVDSETVVLERPPFLEIFRKCKVQHLSLWFVFFVSITCFPTIQANIHRSSPAFLINDKYYTPVTCFLFYNVFSTFGNIATQFVQVPAPRFVWLPCLLRFLFIPFFMFCNFNPASRNLPVLFTNDYAYVVAGVLMAFTHGYFSSLTLMNAPNCVDDTLKATSGMMSACFMVGGIFCGICFSFPIIYLVDNVPADGAELSANSTLFMENATCYSYN